MREGKLGWEERPAHELTDLDAARARAVRGRNTETDPRSAERHLKEMRGPPRMPARGHEQNLGRAEPERRLDCGTGVPERGARIRSEHELSVRSSPSRGHELGLRGDVRVPGPPGEEDSVVRSRLLLCAGEASSANGMERVATVRVAQHRDDASAQVSLLRRRQSPYRKSVPATVSTS